MEEKDKKKKPDENTDEITVQVGKDKPIALNTKKLSENTKSTDLSKIEARDSQGKKARWHISQSLELQYKNLLKNLRPYLQMQQQIEMANAIYRDPTTEMVKDDIKRASQMMDQTGHRSAVMEAMEAHRKARELLPNNFGTSFSAAAHAAMEEARKNEPSYKKFFSGLGLVSSALSDLVYKNSAFVTALEGANTFRNLTGMIFETNQGVNRVIDNAHAASRSVSEFISQNPGVFDAVRSIRQHTDSWSQIARSVAGVNIPASFLHSMSPEIINQARVLPRIELQAVRLAKLVDIPFVSASVNLTSPRHEDYYFESTITPPFDTIEEAIPAKINAISKTIWSRVKEFCAGLKEDQTSFTIVIDTLAHITIETTRALIIYAITDAPIPDKQSIASEIKEGAKEFVKEHDIITTTRSQHFFICKRPVSLRIKPSHLEDPIAFLRKDQIIRLVSYSGKWALVSYLSNREGQYLIGWTETNNLKLLSDMELDHFARQLNK